MDGGAAGFWSYAHADNADDGGGVLRLAERLRAEFSLLTGEELVLFVDRDDVAWGDEWRERIDNALVQTTFFIPVVTPRYFKRDECRRELLSFIGQAESLGVADLVLPILYSDVADLTEDNPDEAVAVVARMHYEDWRELRLADLASTAYKSAVNAMAKRLVEIGTEVAERQMQHELLSATGEEDSEEADLASLIERITELLPDWLDSVIGDRFRAAQYDAISRVHVDRMEKLRRGRAPASARFAQVQRFGAEQLPLAERYVELARIYHARTIDLDPLVTAAVRIVKQHPRYFPLLDDLVRAVNEAVPVIHETRASAESGNLTIGEYAKEIANVSRVWRRVGQAYLGGKRLATEANNVVLAWASTLQVPHSDGGSP